jgi:cation diffusion facilitator CzcD-associated flavoprotein CzcO
MPSSSAISLSNAWLAAPSTGGAVTLARRTPSLTPSTRSAAERGVRRTAKRTSVPDSAYRARARALDAVTGIGFTARVYQRSALHPTCRYSRCRSRTEEGPADPDDRRALLDGDLKVVAHAHR